MEDCGKLSVILLFPFEITYLILYAVFIRCKNLVKIVLPGNPKSLRGEIILVTGGANGIGRAICNEICRREKILTIIIWDVNETLNQIAVSELADAGVKNVFAYKVDVGDRKQVSAAAQRIRKEIGDVTMLFNNAGIAGNPLDGWKEDPDIFEKVFAVNFFSHSWTLREFLPKMIENGKGHVVATCSLLGLVPSVTGCAYGPSKFAVNGLMESMKEDLRNFPGKPKIKFSTVYPGAINTDMIATFNAVLRRYSFMTPKIMPSDLAANVLDGVLHDEEYIHVPRLNVLIHFLMNILPSEVLRKFSDFAGVPNIHDGSINAVKGKTNF